ncbi:hypothetical protein GCM10025868_26270 [Angustibacter aerolatus]|uniref:Carbonic anhydrase n=1 Tax=Angustibacter aerolatus TaxID=1162965 RepID=A0ABQ6JKJ6_9ACTN|nr:hypothetical protein GCM10025868_26270 [Angustibacter aerolatus]
MVPNVITSSGPGDLFTVRTIGALVPEHAGHEGAGEATLAAVEYAVLALGVRHVVVCGHTDCGAMRALAGGVGDTPMPAVTAWLRHGAPVLAAGADSRQPDEPGPGRGRGALDTLRRNPTVAPALRAGTLDLTGLLFDIGAASCLVLDERTGAFEESPSIDLRTPSQQPVAGN